MDTHIAPPPTIPSDDAPVSARLPGETANPLQPDRLSTVEAVAEPGPHPAAAAPAKRSRRGKLFAGVAAAALLAGAGVFLISSYNTIYPVPGLVSSVRKVANDVGVPLPPILAPSAPLAKVTVPPKPPVYREAHQARPREQQIAEISSLHGAANTDGANRPSQPPDQAPAPQAPPPPKQASMAQPVPAAPADAHPEPSGSVASHGPQPALSDTPHEPGANFPVQAPIRQSATAAADRPQDTPPMAAPQDATAAIVSALAPSLRTPAPTMTQPVTPPVTQPSAPSVTPSVSVGASLPAPVPQRPDIAPAAATPVVAAAPIVPDPVVTSQKPFAGPAPRPDDIHLMGLVTELGRLVKDLRTQTAQLRDDLGRSTADTSAHLRDYERRLAMGEASAAVRDAGEAPNLPLSSGPGQPGAEAQLANTRGLPASTARPAVVPAGFAATPAPKAYHVQAASPGLALLAEVDRGGGEGAQRQVVVGDSIPEYGRVKSIVQKGTAWVVMTEHGPIQ